MYSRNERGSLGISSARRTVELKITTNFLSARCKPFRIGFHSAAYARGHARGESRLELTLGSTVSLTQTRFPSYVRVPSVSSVSEIASFHTLRGCTPFRDPITFEDISKIATSATLIPTPYFDVPTRRTRRCWMTLMIFRSTSSWFTTCMSN